MAKALNQNAGKLARFMLRRDRLRIPIWLVAIVGFVILVALVYESAYGEDGERQAMAETMKNPAMIAMIGKGYGIDDYTLGAMMAHQMLLFTAIAAAIMSILFVVRHTRADEEAGRIELVRSFPTGRLAHLTATVAVAIGMNVILALLLGLGLAALQIESMDVTGSLVFGAAVGATGMIFTAMTAVFAQLSENARGATGYAFLVLGLAYLIRAIGDVGDGVVSWISPLGWILESRAYVENHWGPLLLTVVAALVLTGFAFYLNAIRDLDAGFLPSRPGRKHASIMLRNPFGLLLRIQRTGLVAWAVGMFIFGASYGSVMGDLESFFAENELFQQLIHSEALGFSMTEQFMTMLMSVLAMIGAIPVLMAILKLVGEESKGRAEHLFARVVSRCQLMFSALLLSFLTSVVMLSLSGIGLWLAGNAVVDGGMDFGRIYSAAVIYLPAVWVMVGLAVVLIGFLPRLTSLVWVYLIYSFLVVYMGGLFNFPDWMAKLTPFGQIPKIPVEEMDYAQVAILTLIAVILIVIGMITYRKRDLEGI
mgnify:CR=1 FL=1